jgi:hypothetical protein
LGLAALHAAQGVAVALLSKDFTLPVTTSYLTYDSVSKSLVPDSHILFHVHLAWLVVAFFAICAVAHLVGATVYRKGYEANLVVGMNKARWYEYALSASTMMAAIALLVGVYDLGSLGMIFALTAGMNLAGLLMEVHNQNLAKPNWLSFTVGAFLGIVPWLVIALCFWGSNHYGSGHIPTFVYWIYGSIFIFFNCFALNMWLQYRKVGRWADYLYGERVYMLLSLVAKSLLAWQVFAGTLRP